MRRLSRRCRSLPRCTSVWTSNLQDVVVGRVLRGAIDENGQSQRAPFAEPVRLLCSYPSTSAIPPEDSTERRLEWQLGHSTRTNVRDLLSVNSTRVMHRQSHHPARHKTRDSTCDAHSLMGRRSYSLDTLTRFLPLCNGKLFEGDAA